MAVAPCLLLFAYDPPSPKSYASVDPKQEGQKRPKKARRAPTLPGTKGTKVRGGPNSLGGQKDANHWGIRLCTRVELGGQKTQLMLMMLNPKIVTP